MQKIKIGDKVRLIKESETEEGFIRLGAIGEVVGLNGATPHVRFQENDWLRFNHTCWWLNPGAVFEKVFTQEDFKNIKPQFKSARKILLERV